MAEDIKTLDDLKSVVSGSDAAVADEAPREPVRDELGRSYATGKRKDAVARVWVKPGSGKVVVNGKDIADNVTIAFGGAAPLHAARLCEKLGIDRCIVPQGAGVGSAIGFLKAPFGYEALASRLTRLSEFDAAEVNRLLADLKASAEGFVRAGTRGGIAREITAFMRYAGQGWEIPVPLADRPFAQGDAEALRELKALGVAVA